VGYVAGPEPIIKAMAKLQSQTTSGTAHFSQYGLIEALQGDQGPVEEMRKEFERRADYMHERLNQIKGVRCVQPTGAFYAFPNVSESFAGLGVKGSIEFAAKVLEEAHVALVPGGAFGMDTNVRLSFAASMEQIKKGLVADIYFERTKKILASKGIDMDVKAEFVAHVLPSDWQWAVLAGVEECAEVLKDLPVEVRAMKEGTIFGREQPVTEISGKYLEFGQYETALLGLICQASGIATMAARCRKAAGEKELISFGARRVHPTLAPFVERNAYIGGCNGVSATLGANLIGKEPTGTMPHALILIIGDTVEATEAFDEVIEPRVKRVSLIDTFNDEKAEALNVAHALGEKLYAVRLDTPGSRRGDFLAIMREVRWELDLRGYKNMKLLISGGIHENDIERYNPVADAYGIGTAISSAPAIDFSMDIVEIEGKPISKRGKMSGSKSVFRCRQCGSTRVSPAGQKPGRCACGGTEKNILIPFVAYGNLQYDLPTATQIRDFVLKQLDKLEL
jgi:nicotinate phosphoribosyltransferase